jgi:outer membrane protein assembly factor BamB
MDRHIVALAVCCLFTMSPLNAQDLAKEMTAEPIAIGQADWPWWRGPNRNGIAASNQKPPLKWNETDNVRWKALVPGRGHGSPIVVGDQVFVAAADHERAVQAVLCYHRDTGKLLWQTEVHQGGFETKGNKKSSLASCTPACDGRRVFINFLHAGAVYTTALGRDGAKLWQTKVTDYVIHQGYGSSPAVYESLVIVSGDNKGGGRLAALDRSTGKIVWKQERPKTPNYASPIILNVAGRDQVLLTGCDLVAGFEPLSGKKLWEIAGSTTECVTSTVTDGQLIFTSGGYPKSHMSAVRADGSGKVVWENKTRVYVPSLLAHAGHLYGVLDNGVAVCWKCATGKEVWREDLGGTFTASPILVGDQIFATSEEGRTCIFKASPAGFELIAQNQLGDEILATPAICGGRIYTRVAVNVSGRRQEMLYCLGNGP